MGRTLTAIGVCTIVLGAAPAFAVTAKQKLETCQFGADHQNLTGAARKSFMAKCMANRDSPRGKPVAEPKP